MKILYIDCFSGISGDMTVGALVDLGVNPAVIENELKKLKLENEYQLHWHKVVKKGITATKFDVDERVPQHVGAGADTHHAESTTETGDHHHEDSPHVHGHSEAHHHHHDHRHYKDIVKMIEEAGFNETVTRYALEIFRHVAQAEGKIHNLPLDEVHFHEVGAVDSIVDIVATAICLDELKPDQIIAAPVPVGGGRIRIDHGLYPVPAPATLEMLKEVPIQESQVHGELTTPTGAAIVKAVVTQFGPLPSMTISAIGYGAGTKDFPDHPNVLRLVLGETY